MVDKYIENESPFWQTNSGLNPKKINLSALDFSQTKNLTCFGFLQSIKNCHDKIPE